MYILGPTVLIDVTTLICFPVIPFEARVEFKDEIMYKLVLEAECQYANGMSISMQMGSRNETLIQTLPKVLHKK